VRTQRNNSKANWLIVQIGIFCLFSFLVASCNKDGGGNGKNAPKINFTELSGNVLKVGSNQYLNVNFNFSDKDGDLGVSPSSGDFDIYTIDNRDTTFINYFFPKDLNQYIDPTHGVTGQCALGIQAAFLTLRPDRLDGDTVRFEIYIRDKAGNESNRFTTPDIYLIP